MFAIVLIMSSATAFAQTNNSKADAILGVWINAKKDAKFEIYKNGSKYFGKIIWGTGGDVTDTKNPDPKLRSRELIGLSILTDFSFDGSDTWDNGTIYDPKDGKTYSCKLSLKNKNELNVRGYVGVSLFGRTEVWTRTN